MSIWKVFNITVNFKGEEIQVRGRWYEGHGGYVSTFNNVLGEPPEPSEVEFEEIEFEGVDIFPFLCEDFLDELEEIVLQEI